MSSDVVNRSKLAITRASLPQALTYTGSSNTALPGNLAIMGSLAIAGSLSVAGVSTSGAGSSAPDNVYGSVLMRVFDDSAVYAGQTLTAGTALPPPFLTRPLIDVPTGSITLTQAVFGSATAYSARLAGYLCPPTTGTYLWRTTYRDGATMYIGTQKVMDSWTYTGSVTQAVGTLSMTQGVWTDIVLEHAASSTLTERLLVEFSTNSGTVYSTLAHGTTSGQFQMAYNIREVPTAMLGTSYVSGRTYFADTAAFNSALVLLNTTAFTGKSSELLNDAGYLSSGTASNITCQSMTANVVVASTMTGTTSIIGANLYNPIPASTSTFFYAEFSGGSISPSGGSNYVLPFQTAVLSKGLNSTNYNNSTNTFTCPTTGYWLITATSSYYEGSSSVCNATIGLFQNGNSVASAKQAIYSGSAGVTNVLTRLLLLNAGDALRAWIVFDQSLTFTYQDQNVFYGHLISL
ncbi:g886 [Coccomyxa elongata]